MYSLSQLVEYNEPRVVAVDHGSELTGRESTYNCPEINRTR